MSQAWKSIEDWFESFWKRKEQYCFQFHDARAAMGAAQSRRVFTTSHPSDFLVTDCGDTFYAEVKDCHDAVSFPFKNVKVSQWQAAIKLRAAYGKYYFFLHSQVRQCWYRVPGHVLVDLYKAGRKSVKWAELAEYLWQPPTLERKE